MKPTGPPCALAKVVDCNQLQETLNRKSKLLEHNVFLLHFFALSCHWKSQISNNEIFHSHPHPRPLHPAPKSKLPVYVHGYDHMVHLSGFCITKQSESKRVNSEYE